MSPDTTLQRYRKYISERIKYHREKLWVGLCLALVGWSAYNLGLIRAHGDTKPLQEASVFQAREGIVSPTAASAGFDKLTTSGQGSKTPAPDRTDPRVVASKSSNSKKYHHPWCSGAKQIKEANRLWFPSADAARTAGYTLAGNCTE